MIEGLFAVRKSNFAEFPAVEPELELVDADDQITHEISLDDQMDPGLCFSALGGLLNCCYRAEMVFFTSEPGLDIFHVDPEFEKHEEQWAELKKEFIGDDSAGVFVPRRALRLLFDLL